MSTTQLPPVQSRAKLLLPELYELDETAWLEEMAELIEQGRLKELDLANLAEFLQDMARRDKREVLSRLAVLLAHLLKWEHQPDQRSGSWQATIEVQRDELRDLLESATLRHHAREVLPKAYERARRQAIAETGLDAERFPSECDTSLEDLTRAK